MEIPGHGTFAIFIQGGSHHGLWQLSPYFPGAGGVEPTSGSAALVCPHYTKPKSTGKSATTIQAQTE